MPEAPPAARPAPQPSLRERVTPARAALALGVAAVVYRLWAILAEVPFPTGDEQLTGIVAKHVSEGRSFPTYLYGQYYMGAFEAYVAAPFVAVVGTNVAGLRLGMLALYCLFLFSSYRLAARVFSPWFGVLVAGVLALGSDRVLRNELLANGGYPEMLALGALLALVTAEIALHPSVRRRLWLVAAWGVTAGLVVWADWLIAPYVGVLGLVLLAFRLRDVVRPHLPVLLVACAAGLFPMIWHNVHAPEGQDTLSAVLVFDEASEVTTAADRYHYGVLVNVPRATGMCGVECASWQLWWGVAYQLLLVVALVVGAVTLWRGVRSRAREQALRGAMVLALTLAAIATVYLYAQGPRAALEPYWNARYLSNLLISTPAVLWPLWLLATWTRSRAARVAGAAVIAAVLVTGLTATVAVATQALPKARQEQRDLHALIDALDRMGADRAYTDFQLCYRIMYTTGERVVCAMIDDKMVRGWDRYLPHRDEVDAAPRPVYILRAREPMDDQFQAHLREAGATAEMVETAGWRIYRPDRPLDIPR